MTDLLPHTVLGGDPAVYRQRIAPIFAGQMPYFDYPYEHAPGMVVPMAVAWAIGGFVDTRSYVLAFLAVTSACTLATAWLLSRMEPVLAEERLASRWLLLSIPLLPLVLYRSDPWVVLLAVLGIWLASRGRHRGSVVAMVIAVFSKVWPGVWAITEWRRKRKWSAALLMLSSGLCVAVLLSPAVRQIQNPSGLHSETLVGSVLGLTRSLGGSDLGLIKAAAVQIDAPGWAVFANGAVGLALGMICVVRTRGEINWRRAWMLTGGLVGSYMLTVPAFSTQYLAWTTPFLAAERNFLAPGLVVNVLGLGLLITWPSMFDGAVWWWALLVVRNLIFLTIIGFAVSSRQIGRGNLVGRGAGSVPL